MAAYLRQAADLQIHAVDGGYIVRNTGTNAVHHLNGTAALLLELCTGDTTVDQILSSVRRTFGLPTRQMRGVREAVDALIGVGLVVRVERETRAPRADATKRRSRTPSTSKSRRAAKAVTRRTRG